MKDELAERLLAKVMKWTATDVARERPILQAMAAFKYDEYQQFSPGMRFVESLALWLDQFGTAEERALAYDFVMRKLVFCSGTEMSHLVSIAYPDFIRPRLLREVAAEAGLNERHVAKVADSLSFLIRQRQCLFLGLSDGARIDAFRRYNREDLSHEQVWLTYEISPRRADSLLAKLCKSIEERLGISCADVPDEFRKFRTVVLLDDFSASGISYLRREPEGFDGKIAAFHKTITTASDPVSRLVDLERTEVMVVLYMATERARLYLEDMLRQLWEPLGVNCSVIVVYPLPSQACLQRGVEPDFDQLLSTYYDSAIEDEHSRKGGSDLKYGFNQCGLPLILSHNTPNNSLALLWARTDRVRPLFPRVNRH